MGKCVVAIVSLFLVIGCVVPEPDHSATRTAETRRDATVVARAVRTIQATTTAKENQATCLAEPTRCRSLGLDWQETVRRCQAAGNTGCNAYALAPRRLSSPLRPQRPERPELPRPQRPSLPQRLVR